MSNATDIVLEASPELSEAAPAKINLALHVTGQRTDGYHLLDTLAVFTCFADRVTVAPAKADTFTVAGPFSVGVPVGADNLVIRARDLLRRLADRPCPPVALALEKNIPAASGIGGGSSDAAAAIRALARHWHLDLSAETLAAAALSLGDDLPMCLAARPLIARGIGEAIAPVPFMAPLHMVLVNPRIEIPTPSVFSALTRRDGAPLPPLPDPVDLPALLDWLPETRNDLEPAARSIAPEISQALDALRAHRSAFTRMSGSGATCFGLFASHKAAEEAAHAIAAAHPSWYVEATTTIEKAHAHVAH